MRFTGTVLFYLAAWFTGIALLAYHYHLQQLVRRWVSMTMDPAAGMVLLWVIGLVAVPAGFVFVFPLVWGRRKEGFSFNHAFFWPYFTPLVFVSLFGVLYFNQMFGELLLGHIGAAWQPVVRTRSPIRRCPAS